MLGEEGELWEDNRGHSFFLERDVIGPSPCLIMEHTAGSVAGLRYTTRKRILRNIQNVIY